MNNRILHNLFTLCIFLVGGSQFIDSSHLSSNTITSSSSDADVQATSFIESGDYVYYKTPSSGEFSQTLKFDAIEKEEDDENKSNKKYRKSPHDFVQLQNCSPALLLIALENRILSFHSPSKSDSDRYIRTRVFRI